MNIDLKITKLNQIRDKALSDIEKISSSDDLNKAKVQYLGRKGELNQQSKELKKLVLEDRQQLGRVINQVKTEIQQVLTTRKKELEQSGTKELDQTDTSLPGIRPQTGFLHPSTQVMRQVNSFFRYLGYSVYEGPEIETDDNNFAKLNLPLDHPARDLADTLYIKEPDYLLRTHTSSVEIRAMLNEKLPLRIVVPGKVYRNETTNTTNNSMFYQYEGLVVDKNINMSSLKGTLVALAKFLYGEEVKTRFRCKYYPQVEPGAGMDIQCTFCGGKGCPVCKHRGWIEVLGAGMVHPNTLKACKVDTNKWSGFAFGMGFDRLVMLKYGISDVRKLYNGELVIEEIA